MAVSGAAKAGAPLIQVPRNDYAQQVFVLQRTPDGWGTLVHTGSQLVVGVAGGSTADGAKLILWTPDGSANQQWRVEERPGGNVLINKGSGKVIGVWGGSKQSGAALLQWHADGTPNQLWLFMY